MKPAALLGEGAPTQRRGELAHLLVSPLAATVSFPNEPLDVYGMQGALKSEALAGAIVSTRFRD